MWRKEWQLVCSSSTLWVVGTKIPSTTDLPMLFSLCLKTKVVIDMLRVAALFFLICGSLAQAETVEVPLLPDGRVDLDATIPTFSASRPILTTGQLPEFIGSILGQSYTATFDDADLIQPFDLTIRSIALSEHAYFLVAVLLNDIICHDSDLKPDEIQWHETAVSLGDGWKVQLSCSE